MQNPALSIRLSRILLVALANALSLSSQELPVRPASSFLDPQNGAVAEADLRRPRLGFQSHSCWRNVSRSLWRKEM